MDDGWWMAPPPLVPHLPVRNAGENSAAFRSPFSVLRHPPRPSGRHLHFSRNRIGDRERRHQRSQRVVWNHGEQTGLRLKPDAVDCHRRPIEAHRPDPSAQPAPEGGANVRFGQLHQQRGGGVMQLESHDNAFHTELPRGDSARNAGQIKSPSSDSPHATTHDPPGARRRRRGLVGSGRLRPRALPRNARCSRPGCPQG